MEEQKPKVLIEGGVHSGVGARLAKSLSALAIAFGALPQQLTRTMRSFESTGRIRSKGGRQYPFSSKRQDMNSARKMVSVLGPNGHYTMQTLPAGQRLTIAQAERRLAGKSIFGTD